MTAAPISIANPTITTGFVPKRLMMNPVKKLGANIATTCQRMTSRAIPSLCPKPTMASGVGAMSRTMIPIDTAPTITAVATGPRRRIDSVSDSVAVFPTVTSGFAMRTNASGINPINAITEIAAYPPASGTGAK